MTLEDNKIFKRVEQVVDLDFREFKYDDLLDSLAFMRDYFPDWEDEIDAMAAELENRKANGKFIWEDTANE